MKDIKSNKTPKPKDDEMVEGGEELTKEDKAMYMILFGKDWDEEYPSKGKKKG